MAMKAANTLSGLKTMRNSGEKKIETNIERDARKIKQLEDSGWNVIIIWECQLRSEEREETLRKLVSALQSRLYDLHST